MQAALLVNPGGNSYLGGWTGAVTGVILDGRDTSGGSASGQVEVKPVSDVGLFTLLEAGTLANLAPLTGSTQRYELTAAVVSDRDDAAATATAVSVSEVACATSAPSAVLVLDGCTIELGALSGLASGSGGAVVSASYGELQLSAEARFVVWVPGEESVELRVEDALLQRLAFPAGGGTVDCDAAQRYQRTEVTANPHPHPAPSPSPRTLTLTPHPHPHPAPSPRTLTRTLTLTLTLTRSPRASVASTPRRSLPLPRRTRASLHSSATRPYRGCRREP